MTNELDDRSKRFSELFGAELKGAIASHGYSQGQVADALGNARSSMSKWLTGKVNIDVADARKICDYVGADMGDVVAAAGRRLEEEKGPWPPIVVNEDAVAEINSRKSVPEFHMAAKHSKRKRSGGGVDAEFAD